MRTKPVGTAASALMAGVLLAGCETGRLFSDGPHSYAPPPAPASLSYAQVPGWAAQPRAFAAASPSAATTVASMKADGTPGPTEVTSALQLVSGTSIPPSSTPMLTVTLPAVKFLVPINGSYSYTPPAGATAATAPATDAVGHAAVPATDGQVMRTTQPMPAAAPATPPTIHYLVPTTPGMQPTIQYVPAQPAAGNTHYLPTPVPAATPAPGPRLDETVPVAKPVLAPPPNWPRPNESAEGVAPEMAPPPPPVRHPASMPAQGAN